MNIWLAGISVYETAGVEALLADRGIKGKIFRRGDRLMKGDSLVLCFSEIPLLGWWRWLRLIQWLSARYSVCLIVLCPSVVYSMKILHGKNIVPVNGEQGKKGLCDRLCSVLCRLRNERVNGKQGRNEGIYRFWRGASRCLLENPLSEQERNLVRKAYHRRAGLLLGCGLGSLHVLRVFMAGFNLQGVLSLPGKDRPEVSADSAVNEIPADQAGISEWDRR